MATAGHVNRATLESWYQAPGDVYEDTKTEGALEELADQIDVNWDGVLPKTNTTAFTPTTQYHPATKKYVDDAIVGVIAGTLPLDSVSTEYLADDAVTSAKIASDTIAYSNMSTSLKTDLNGGLIYAYKNLGGAL